MKKLAITIIMVLGFGLASFAGDGLFNRGGNANNGGSGYAYFGTRDGDNSTGIATPLLPSHGQNTDQNAPLGSGMALLAALGGAYLAGKKITKK